MEANEAGTLAALKALCRELVDIKIAEHQGRIFKLTGDGMLAEFPSVIDALAVDIIALDNHVAEVDPDSKLDAAVGRNV